MTTSDQRMKLIQSSSSHNRTVSFKRKSCFYKPASKKKNYLELLAVALLIKYTSITHRKNNNRFNIT